MINYEKLAGSADVSVVVRIVDATTGAPETGVTSATAGLALRYRREGAANVDLTESNLSALTDAHSDGGMFEIGNGYYRVDVPDAAFAAGVPGVLIHGTVTDMVVIGAYVHLVAFNSQDAVRLGLTALPNAAAEAAGGLYTRGSGAGQINQAANGQVDVNVEALDASATAATLLALSARGIVAVTVAAGATVNTVPTDLTETTDDHYNNRSLVFITGALAGQAAPQILSYDGSTCELLVTPMTEAPASLDIAVIV